MKQRQVRVEDLKLGMYVNELDRPWLETPFLFQGFPILTQHDIDQLQQYCRYVYVDDDQSVHIRPGQASASEHKKPVQRFQTRRMNIREEPALGTRGRQRGFVETLPEAREVYRRAHHYITDLFGQIRQGRPVDLGQAQDLASRTVDNIVDNENAMLWLTLLKRKDEYTSFHSINVCALSVLFGSHLGLKDSELRLLGMGALLHDVGKMRIPSAILNKPQALDTHEMAIIREHPQLGIAILDEREDVPPLVREVVYSHHERYDGSGYPRGLQGEEINLFAMIVSIVDVYDAMTSDRAYHERISSHEVLNMMYGWHENEFRRDLLEEFIRCLGIYPVGSLVELSSGEVGVVMAVNREHNLRPMVLLVLDMHKKPYDTPRIINLAVHWESGTPIHINRILPSDAFNLNVRQIVLDNDPTTIEEIV